MSAVRTEGEGNFASAAHAFAAVHADRATETLITNVRAHTASIFTDAGPLPVSVHDGLPGDAWVCSPTSTYADYAAEEAARYLPPWAAPLSRTGIAAIGVPLRSSGLDRAVCVNNWLLSTNLYPSLAQVNPVAVLAEATERWPQHAVWFRSLNADDNADWIDALRAAGCVLVASRQVYLYDAFETLHRRHQNLRWDIALLQKTPLRHCADADIVDTDYVRIAELYAMLYIGKHSRFNPVYTAEFLRLWHRAGLLQFEGFRDEDNRLACIVGLFRLGRTATAPIVGYDTAQPQKRGLYRLATACAYRACQTHGWRLNFSAGAAGFKRLRGGVPSIEYSAVYARHLPRRTRAVISALSATTCRLGVPLLRGFQL